METTLEHPELNLTESAPRGLAPTRCSSLKVLNLYAGLGGNRKNWQNVEVASVELDPKIAEVYSDQHPNDNLIIGDAHQYLLDHAHEYDFVWTSPPCQTHSKMMKATRHKKGDIQICLYTKKSSFFKTSSKGNLLSKM